MTNLSYDNKYICYQFHIVPGPSICAWISVMSSSFGNILIPSGGSLHKSAISLATPLITCGDKFSTFETYNKRDYKWTLLANQKRTFHTRKKHGWNMYMYFCREGQAWSLSYGS